MPPPEKILWMTPAALDFFKWVISTIVIGGFAMGIGLFKDANDLRLKEMEVDSKLITAVSDKYLFKDDSVFMQKNEAGYLQFISTFITTKELADKISRRQTNLKSIKITTKANTIDSATAAAKKNVVTNNLMLANKLQAIDDVKPASPISMNKFIAQNKAAIKNDTTGIGLLTSKPVADAYKAIELANSSTTPGKIADDYYLTGTTQTLWCKTNYYVVFNNILRIGVDAINIDPNTKSATVNFKDDNTGGVVQKSTILNINAPINVDYQGTRYQVTLSYIGGAGLNPFTKAAYITVAVYNKTGQ